MGVPKFFRYISERYPCLSELVKEYQIPDFDNMYLDMNGIIHTCSHPNDANAHFRITEEEIFKAIFDYLDALFRLVKPRKLFFMAVDGVAPRAKMNQQRGRRFRSAKESEDKEKEAIGRGEKLPETVAFDSNCITPGTEFMVQLQAQLKYFITKKISTDDAWKNCQVVLSGHETPGEGEHKIMDYIRYLRSQPGYDRYTRHCLYGLDADLIMLGLCSHEVNFSLLREEVKFGKQQTKRITTAEENSFFLLHLSLMRDYIEQDFLAVKKTIPFEYDLEKIIDDWVLMGFLVGNDFIPHLPNLHIHKGALPLLYETYQNILPTLGGYINESGSLNVPRFAKFMKALMNFDLESFQEDQINVNYLEMKRGIFRDTSNTQKMDSDLKICIDQTLEMFSDDDEFSSNDDENESTDEDNSDKQLISDFKTHRENYYRNKLEYEHVTPDVLRSQAVGYVRAIQWNLHYYYNGCVSWSWYYPHHYAPYISDIKDFDDIDLTFERGRPFKPFEQLLAVLPSASKNLLPPAYHQLMTDANSPIKSYYPTDFQTDKNGKRQDWEAVVLLPFISEEKLIEAMATCEPYLTAEEVKRNQHGPMLVYQYSPNSFGYYYAPKYFDVITENRAFCVPMSIEDIRVPNDQLVKGPYRGVDWSLYFPGFPKLKNMNFTSRLEVAKVRVFNTGFSSPDTQNMILSIIPSDPEPCIATVAEKWLDQEVYVGWPHMYLTKVSAIWSIDKKYEKSDDGRVIIHDNSNNENEQKIWRICASSISTNYKSRLGIVIGPTELLILAKPMIGKKYEVDERGNVSLVKQWATNDNTFAYQATIKDLHVFEEETTTFKNVDEMFPVDSTCYLLANPNYGALVKVQDTSMAAKTGRIKVSIEVEDEPNFSEAWSKYTEKSNDWMPGYIVAERLGISGYLVHQITSNVVLEKMPANNDHASLEEERERTKRYYVGLNLRSEFKHEELSGYTQKQGKMWMYSMKTVYAIEEYMKLFPELFDFLSNPSAQQNRRGVFKLDDVLKINNAQEHVERIVAWLKSQEFADMPRERCGGKTISTELTQVIERDINEFYSNRHNATKYRSIQVKINCLYKPEIYSRCLQPDPQATYNLLDRVVNFRTTYKVPCNFKGTIIGIKPMADLNPTAAAAAAEKVNLPTVDKIYDVLFDKSFPSGMSINGCSEGRAYRLPATALINLTYGRWSDKKSKIFSACSTRYSIQTKPIQVLQRPTSVSTSTPKAPENQNNRVNTPNLGKNHTKSVANEPNSRQETKKIAKPGGVSELNAMWKELKTNETSLQMGQMPAKLETAKVEDELSNKLKQMLNIKVASPKKNQPMPTSQLPNPPAKPKLEWRNMSSVLPNETLNAATAIDHNFSFPNLTPSYYPSNVVPTVSNTGASTDANPNTSSTLQLLELFQRMRGGVPKYVFENIYDPVSRQHLVRASLLLPGGDLHCSAPKASRESAAEDVAKKVLVRLQQVPPEPAVLPTPVENLIRTCAPAPDKISNILPPSQWFNDRQNTFQQPPNIFMPLWLPSQSMQPNNQNNKTNGNNTINSHVAPNLNSGQLIHSAKKLPNVAPPIVQRQPNSNPAHFAPNVSLSTARGERQGSGIQMNPSVGKLNSLQSNTSPAKALGPIPKAFVPLQAIKRQRNRVNSGPKNVPVVQSNEPIPAAVNVGNTKAHVSSDVPVNKASVKKKSNDGAKKEKPRRLRQPRLAANFGGKFNN